MPTQRTESSSSDDQPKRAENIRVLSDYFTSGIKPATQPGRIGIELEHTIVRNNLAPVPYSGNAGVARVLELLSERYPLVTRDAEGDILGVARPGEAITIEPAAQIELSAGPFESLSDAWDVYSGFENVLDQALAEIDAQALGIGYHPTAKALELELIPKRRYHFMNEYLQHTGSCGPCMMRGSCSTQVSIDYTSADDCLRKMRTAFRLTPLLSLMCDNSPVFEGKPRTRKLERTYIWRNLDPDRSETVDGALDDSFSLEDYAAYILDTPAILIRDAQSGEWTGTSRTFGEIYAEAVMTREQAEHALSMVFPDVRLKTYVEIRPADSMPAPFALSYAALIKGLFYGSGCLDELDRLLSGVSQDDVAHAKDALMRDGYAATVYGRSAALLCDELVSIGRAGLPHGEREFLEPLAGLVRTRVTLADIAEKTGPLRALCTFDQAERMVLQA